MVKALSVDLRTRVLAAVSAGASQRVAAARFGVGARA
jgi:transposase